MRLFSYVVARDSGYSPNPFHDVCTLACCKSTIRITAKPGDLIFGIAPRSVGNGLVYGMIVAEKMSFADYWKDPRFRAKRPDPSSASRVVRSGDNHYEPLPGGGYRQHRSRHSNKDGTENLVMKRRDLGALADNPVLIGGRYCYLGTRAPALPAELDFLIVGRGHRCQFTRDQIQLAYSWFTSQPTGVQGPPRVWPDDGETLRSVILSNRGDSDLRSGNSL